MKTLKSRRGRELLGDRALWGLSDAERDELASLLRAEGLADDESFDLAAAAVDLATLPPAGAMPPALAARLERDLVGAAASRERRTGARPQTSTTAAGSQVVVMPAERPEPRRDWTRWSGWLAAAAAVCFVVGQRVREPGGTGERAAGGAPSASAARGSPPRLFRAVGDSRATGARAELSWSDATGRGELRVVGLPAGSYEVWIEDAARTDGNRLAAGTLVSRGNGEAVATVAPPILAAKPARAILTAPSSASELLSVPMSP